MTYVWQQAGVCCKCNASQHRAARFWLVHTIDGFIILDAEMGVPISAR